MIHTFGAVIEQLSLAIEITVKCSHAELQKCEYILMQSIWEMGTYSHSGIELYIHIYIKLAKH